MADKKKSKSGPTKSYGARAADGRPMRSFTMSSELDALISELAARRGTSRSGIIEIAVRELAKSTT